MSQKYSTEIPKWKDMPEPEALLTKSWEDFYPSAQEITQKKWKRDPTKDELSDIFEECDEIDCEAGTYWSTVEAQCDYYYDRLCNVCGKGECECEE